MPKFSYDRAARDNISLHGWSVDELIDALIDDAVKGCCEHCAGGDCVHNAARSLRGLKRIVEHDPDCPDCAAIRAMDHRTIVDRD